MTEPMILLKNLQVAYGGQPVLQDVNLTVAAGEATVIVGPSGAGKTTILKTLLGLLPKMPGLRMKRLLYAAFLGLNRNKLGTIYEADASLM